MGVKDPDVRRALETLEDEFENLEESIKDKEDELSDLQEENDKLTSEVEELRERVKELEEALAEAYLTSESEDGVQGEDGDVSPGCGTDVPDSAGDETVD